MRLELDSPQWIEGVKFMCWQVEMKRMANRYCCTVPWFASTWQSDVQGLHRWFVRDSERTFNGSVWWRQVDENVLTITAMTSEKRRVALKHRIFVHFAVVFGLRGLTGTCPAMFKRLEWLCAQCRQPRHLKHRAAGTLFLCSLLISHCKRTLEHTGCSS